MLAYLFITQIGPLTADKEFYVFFGSLIMLLLQKIHLIILSLNIITPKKTFFKRNLYN